VGPQLSFQKIEKPSNKDIQFAQTALTRVGFKIGPVDGYWGKLSRNALVAFEAQNKLQSASGSLSELNLHHLEKMSGLSRDEFDPTRKISNRVTNANKPKKIAQLLNKQSSLKKGPQLIIVERDYLVMTKPNPYSSKLIQIEPGAGIYVIAMQDNWYQIETLERQAGFVAVD